VMCREIDRDEGAKAGLDVGEEEDEPVEPTRGGRAFRRG
jgi:hypothetical protein